MTSADMLLFAVATVSYAMVPGPGTIYIAAHAVGHDPKAALWGALGLHIGGYLSVIASAAGLTALFTVVPVLYEAFKLLGAAYLVWLGVRMVVHRAGGGGTDPRGRSRVGRPRSLAQGVLVEVLNPTTPVFYVAFLPQFIAPDGAFPIWSQFVVLGVAVNLIFSLGDVVTIVIAAKVRATATNNEHGQRILRWLAGTVLVGLGLRLA